MQIAELLLQSESENLDFKQIHHADTVALLHDILCLGICTPSSARSTPDETRPLQNDSNSLIEKFHRITAQVITRPLASG